MGCLKIYVNANQQNMLFHHEYMGKSTGKGVVLNLFALGGEIYQSATTCDWFVCKDLSHEHWKP